MMDTYLLLFLAVWAGYQFLIKVLYITVVDEVINVHVYIQCVYIDLLKFLYSYIGRLVQRLAINTRPHLVMAAYSFNRYELHHPLCIFFIRQGLPKGDSIKRERFH